MSMDFLEAVERQLVEATERGVGRRRWRWPWLIRLRLPWRAPTVGIAVGVGAALAASAIAATLTLPVSHSKAHHRVAAVKHVRSFTTAGAVPAGFQPKSFTAISEFTWWLMGEGRCGRHQCLAIVRTTDGGRSFVRIPGPPTTGVTEVRFANARDGFAYGPQLWTTHNGGRTWSEVRIMGADTLAISDGYAYAIYHSGLMRSPVARNRWSAVSGTGPTPVLSLWVQGQTVIAGSVDRILVSTDRGAHFSRRPGIAHAGDCGFDATVDAYVIWALCSTGTAPDEVLRSTDSGSTFIAAATVPDGPISGFAAASATTAVAATQGPLERTTDGGAQWAPALAPSADWAYLGFTDSTHGVAIGSFGRGGHAEWRLYYTIDAGASYHLVPIGPP